MSKAVRGDDNIDRKARKFMLEFKKFNTHRNMDNLSLKILKELNFQTSISSALSNKAIITKIEQSNGGYKGNRRRMQKAASEEQ